MVLLSYQEMFQPSCIKLSRSMSSQKADGTLTGGNGRLFNEGALHKCVIGEMKGKGWGRSGEVDGVMGVKYREIERW